MEASGSEGGSNSQTRDDQSNSSAKQDMPYRNNGRNGHREPLIGSPPLRMPLQQHFTGSPLVKMPPGQDDVSY